MVTSTSSQIPATLFFYDCEVDHKDINLVNITELCVSENNPYQNEQTCSSNEQVRLPYFVGHVKKSAHANYDGPYQRDIPASSERYDFSMILKKVVSFITKNTSIGSISALMGYNVEGWDKPVLENNCDPFQVSKTAIANWKWIDLAKIAHYLGYAMGTTQQQLEVAICAEHLPFNRHRAHADVKVVKQIWRKMTEKMEGNEAALNQIKEALGSEQAEEQIANILKEHDPSLIPTEEVKQVIQAVKDAEKLTRKAVTILFDLETTGLFKESKKAQASSHNEPPRIVEFAAKILSPFKEPQYVNETFRSFVDPGIDIPEEATNLHKITPEMVRGNPEKGIPAAPTMKEVWKQFELWVKTSNTFQRIIQESVEGELIEPQIILVGYNNFRYDNPLLAYELLIAGVDLKREMDRSVKETWDALPLMSTLYTGLPANQKPENNQLQNHAKFLHVEQEGAHRALADVETVERILRIVTHPAEPSYVIAEAVKQKINLSSPGVGFKQIIQESQERIAAEETELEAIKHSIESYITRKQAEKQKQANGEPPKKRTRKEPAKEPTTQDFLVDSQNLAYQTYI